MRRDHTTPDRERKSIAFASVPVQSPDDGIIRQRAPIETPVQPQRQSTVASEESADNGVLRWMEDRPSSRRQTWSEACSPVNASRAAHRALRAELAMFNNASSAAKGLKALRAKGFLAEGAQPVCDFFIANDGKLDLVKIGDFLGSDGDECRAVCRFMIGSLPLAGLSLDSSLRRVIALVKLPGEAQKIDRIIEAFAGHFCSCNPGAIDHVDTAQILAFSLVMLNTDAHNPAIKQERKMTLPQYQKNLRGVCKDGSSPDAKMLEGMYIGICRFPWQVLPLPPPLPPPLPLPPTTIPDT